MQLFTKSFRSTTEASQFIKALDKSKQSDFEEMDIDEARNIKVTFRDQGTQADVDRRMAAIIAVKEAGSGRKKLN